MTGHSSPIAQSQPNKKPPYANKSSQAETRRDRIATNAPQVYNRSGPDTAPIVDHGAFEYSPEVAQQQYPSTELVSPLSPTSPLNSNRSDDSPIHVPREHGLQVASSGLAHAHEAVTPDDLPPELPTSPTDPEKEEITNIQRSERRILGLKRKTFWTCAAVTTILLIAATIGGAVGGTSNKRFTPKPKPQMFFSGQTFENANLTGRSQVFYQTGYYHLSFRARSYHWIPGKFTNDVLWCSISFCQGDQQIGWWGSSDHIGQQHQWGGLEYGDSLAIGCANNFVNPGCPGPLAASSFTTMPIIEASQTPTATAMTSKPVATTTNTGSLTRSSTFQTSVSQTSATT